jgi:hypothetical protein
MLNHPNQQELHLKFSYVNSIQIPKTINTTEANSSRATVLLNSTYSLRITMKVVTRRKVLHVNSAHLQFTYPNIGTLTNFRAARPVTTIPKNDAERGAN